MQIINESFLIENFALSINKWRLHGWRVRTTFTHELRKIAKRTRRRSEPVNLTIFDNKCTIKIVQTSQPCSNLFVPHI